MTTLDKRLNAFRRDLADLRLREQVVADRYVEGKYHQVARPLAAVRREPRGDAMQATEALMGEHVLVFEDQDGWAWVQLVSDGYVGYIESAALTADVVRPTHRVAVPQTFVYPAPNIKAQPAIAVTMNARLAVTGGDDIYAALASGGFIWRAHLRPEAAFAGDYVAVAELYRHVPYYWGGKTARGLDCSGLVQLALEACGIACPRDSDQQEQLLGHRLMVNGLDGLARGDLVFWEGHVGIMTGPRSLLHANGHHMLAVEEPLAGAVDRISAAGKPVTSIRRF
jgi:cell wall-associated NlpC family hydrolase